MHQGKQLKEAADKQKNKGVFAKEIGISRDTLYKLYKKQVIPAKYVEKLISLGVRLTPSDNTKYYSTPGHPLLRVESASNGKSRMLPDSQNKIPSSRDAHGGGMGMAEVLSLSLTELLQLQREGEHDSEMGKLIARLILYQERIKALEEKVLLLKDNLQDLRNKGK